MSKAFKFATDAEIDARRLRESAALDMQIALQAAVNDIEAGALDPSDFPWLEPAKAALAKATGVRQ